MCRYVPGDMWYILHHFLHLVSLAGLVVHSADSAPDFGCLSLRKDKAVLLWFACLLQSWLLHFENKLSMCITFCAQLRAKIEYLHIPTLTCTYMHIHAYTYPALATWNVNGNKKDPACTCLGWAASVFPYTPNQLHLQVQLSYKEYWKKERYHRLTDRLDMVQYLLLSKHSAHIEHNTYRYWKILTDTCRYFV